MSTQHVPAWRRLGLKLRYANEVPESSESAVDSLTSENKRKKHSELNGQDQSGHQLKKPRSNYEQSTHKLTKSHEANVSEETDKHNLKRKKSVTFTPDTKAEDGDSAQTIQFFVPDSPESTLNGTNTDLQTTLQDPSASAETGPSSAERDRKEKKQKPKSAQASSQIEISRKARLALDYLHRFHNDRSSWKFNKNHEAWIINHALSTKHIAPALNLALALYLTGLKSVGARQRLIEQSREDLQEEKGASTNGDTKSKETLVRSLQSDYRNGEEDDVTQIGLISRSKLILWSLGENLQDTRTITSSLSRAKKNKSRTLRVEIESSSSSESEDTTSSDSETDLEPGSDTRLQYQPATPLLTTDIEDTSSSGTSSASSTDDSEESSGADSDDSNSD